MWKRGFLFFNVISLIQWKKTKMLMRSSGLWLNRMPRVLETLERGGVIPIRLGVMADL